MKTIRDGDRYELVVNGERRVVREAEVTASLLTVLRDQLGLTGTKEACSEGACGACSVLLDGVLVDACLVLAGAAAGRSVTTIEAYGGADPDGPLDDVQEALVAGGAIQCGFCTSGFVVAIHDVLTRSPDAAEETVRDALCGNLCRCTGYGRILAAVRSVQQGRSHA